MNACPSCGHGPERCRGCDRDALTARAMAQQAASLAARVRQFHQTLTPDIRVHGFRLSGVAADLKAAAVELEATAADIARHRATPEDRCASPAAGCPEHGSTLVSYGGVSWCPKSGCGRVWRYDRMNFPCDQPRAYRIVDPDGGVAQVCGGHARPVTEWHGWKVEPLL